MIIDLPDGSTDGEDHLGTYLRELGKEPLLSHEEELDLAKNLEKHEILTWQRVFARSEVVIRVIELLTPSIIPPTFCPKLLEYAKKGDLKKLGSSAKRAAGKLRSFDLDRIHIDTVIKELQNTEDPAFIESILRSYRVASRIRDKFIRCNLRLVVKMARKWTTGLMSFQDLIQEGNMGLMHAIARFNYRRKLRFSTYACWWIRHSLMRAISDKAKMVRVPVHITEVQHVLQRERRNFLNEFGRLPTDYELAEITKKPLEKVRFAQLCLTSAPISIDHAVGSENESDDRVFADVLTDLEAPDVSESLTKEQLATLLKKFITFLNPMERDILRNRFGLITDEEQTLSEIGKKYKVSRERIRQIQNIALKKLRTLFDQNDSIEN